MAKFNDFEKLVSFLDKYKIKYKKFEMKDKNADKITIIVAEEKHSMQSESDWMLTVFNSLKEKLVSTSARNNCDYEFDRNYNLECVKNILEFRYFRLKIFLIEN